MESKGKSVDEAIFNGLQEMGLGIDEVDIEIIHEGSKGLFGIGKNAVVKLTQKTEEEIAQQQAVTQEHERQERRDRPERRRDRDNRDSRGRRDRGDRGDRRDRDRDRDREHYDREPVETPPAIEGSENSAPVLFLNELFEKMGVSASSKVVEQDEKITKVVLEGKDTAVLIGRRGDTLDALQYLTGLVVNKGKEDYQKIMLDAENYRKKREITLEKLAKRLANNVSKSGKPVTLEPMNPYERRILHATLQPNPRVETYSEGEEPYRRVIIRRKRRSSSEDEAAE